MANKKRAARQEKLTVRRTQHFEKKGGQGISTRPFRMLKLLPRWTNGQWIVTKGE
jgi:hypothetical protein